MPTLDFCCGAECGVAGVGATPAPDARHINVVQGSGFTNQNTIARNGGRAFRFHPSAAECHIRKATASSARRHWRFYIYFAALPSIDTTLLRLQAAAGTACYLRYRTATTDIIAAIGTSTTGATAQVVTTGVWYRVEFKVDLSTGTRTAALIVDGTPKGMVSASIAASTSTLWMIGASTNGETLNADIYIDDIATGTDVADYPLGAGQIKALFPNRDGTHSFSVAGDFQDDTGTNIAPGATDAWERIAHTINTLSTFLAAALAGTTEYLEWGFDTLTGAGRINGMEVVSAHHAAGTSANKQSARLVDGASVGDIFADVDFSQTTLTQNTKHFPTAPSTATRWTVAQVNAVRVRWGSSWAASDVDPDAYIDAMLLEVDYVPGTFVDCEGHATIELVAEGDITIDPPDILLAGDAVIQLLASGDLIKDMKLAGDASVALVATGDVRQRQVMAGDAAITVTASGDLQLGVNLAGAATVSLVASGDMRARQRMSGAGIVQLVATGDIRQRQRMAGAATISIAAAGNLRGVQRLSGHALVAVVASGALHQRQSLSGAAQVSVTAAGSLTVNLDLAGAAAVSVIAAGDLRQRQRLQGAATVSLVAAGALRQRQHLAGNALVSLAAAGALTVNLDLAGDAVVRLVAAGALHQIQNLQGAAQVSISATGALTIAVPLAGAANVSVVASGDLRQRLRLAGAATVRLVATGDLSQTLALEGHATVELTAEGDLLIRVNGQSLTGICRSGPRLFGKSVY